MKRIFALTLSLLLAFGVFGCAAPATEAAPVAPTAAVAESPAGDAATAGDKEITIVLIPKLVHEFYNYVLDGANQAVEELAAQGYKVNVIWNAPSSADVVEQTEKLEAAIALKPDYIGIAVINGET